MPTTTVKTIKAGGDYTTLQSWEDAAPANYVTADVVWEGQASGNFSSASILLTISGGTVDATRFARLTTAAGASFRDHASVQSNALRVNSSNGCTITLTGSYVNCISVNQEFTEISNLQIAGTGTSGNTTVLASALAGGTSDINIDYCIVESARGPCVNLFGNNQFLRNSLCIQRGASRGAIANIHNGAAAINCTFAVPSDVAAATVGINRSYAAVQIKNCAVYGATAVDGGTGTAPSYTTCKTDVGSPPSGCTTAAYNTTQFAGITNAASDYRIPTGSALKDAGTTDSTNAATDIAKTARPQGSAYDVGCWEFVAAAAAGIVAKSYIVPRQAVNRASTY